MFGTLALRTTIAFAPRTAGKSRSVRSLSRPPRIEIVASSTASARISQSRKTGTVSAGVRMRTSVHQPNRNSMTTTRLISGTAGLCPPGASVSGAAICAIPVPADISAHAYQCLRTGGR